MVKSIAILGPESTGKSSLAAALARHYHCLWVAEYAREYLDRKTERYTIEDVEKIAAEQFSRNEAAHRQADSLWFADTEMLVCNIWCQVVFGIEPQSIVHLIEKQQFDLYLLCAVDLPWQPDPLREHPHRRQELFNRYENELKHLRWPYAIIRGQGNERTECAIEAVNSLLLADDEKA